MVVGLALLAVVTGAPPTAGQVCVGDCGGRGAVGIDDLILAVNIALGLAAPAECPALGEGPIGISDIIASIGNALCECRPCPTPPPRPSSTRTRTASPTPTVTSPPSPTPTPTVVTSRWREDQIKITSSNCAQRVVRTLRAELAGVVEEYRVYERGADSAVESVASGAQVPAVIDGAGVLQFAQESNETQSGCTVRVSLEARVNLRRGTTTAIYTGRIRSAGCPNPINCSFKLSARWTPQAQLGATAARGMPGARMPRVLGTWRWTAAGLPLSP